MNIAELIGDLQKLKLDTPKEDTAAKPGSEIKFLDSDGDAYTIKFVKWDFENRCFFISGELE